MNYTHVEKPRVKRGIGLLLIDVREDFIDAKYLEKLSDLIDELEEYLEGSDVREVIVIIR
jgi:hypothetical protein